MHPPRHGHSSKWRLRSRFCGDYFLTPAGNAFVSVAALVSHTLVTFLASALMVKLRVQSLRCFGICRLIAVRRGEARLPPYEHLPLSSSGGPGAVGQPLELLCRPCVSQLQPVFPSQRSPAPQRDQRSVVGLELLDLRHATLHTRMGSVRR